MLLFGTQCMWVIIKKHRQLLVGYNVL